MGVYSWRVSLSEGREVTAVCILRNSELDITPTKKDVAAIAVKPMTRRNIEGFLNEG